MRLNSVTLGGRLGADPKPINSKTPGCSLSLALDQGEDRTEWVTVKCWDKSAEIAMRYLTKGRQCIIEGRMSFSRYEKNGEERKAFEVVAHRLHLIGGSESNQQNQQSQQPQRPQQAGWGSNNNQQGWGNNQGGWS